MFTERFSGYAGESISCEVDGFTCTATLHADDDTTPPWERHDGHGTVSPWINASMRHGYARKSPGELVLCSDHGRARLYDFAGACKIARRDGWGAPFHSQTIERGANGLRRLRCDWFVGRELHVHFSDWTDELDSSDYAAAHDAMRATYPSARAYAAAAARADYDRLCKWCDDQWQYVGVAVTVEREDVQLTGPYDHALWGIESDAGDYLAEVACELLPEALESARAKIAALSA